MPIGAPRDLTQCRQFFLQPSEPKQRMYEALRAYFIEGKPSHEAARAFGYSPGSFRVLCHQFRREAEPSFFAAAHASAAPPRQPKAYALVIALRKRNYSIYEISDTLKERKLP